MLPNIKTYENRWSNFSENLRAVAMKSNSHKKIYRFPLILYGVEFRCDVDILKLTASAQSIYGEVYGCQHPSYF